MTDKLKKVSQQAPMAYYALVSKADSGYESTAEGRCTADQYGAAMAALHGTAALAQQDAQAVPHEPVARLMKYVGKGTYPKKGYTVARTYEECPKDAYPNDWEEGPELHTHPSPTDLRAEYLRGLDDAKAACKHAAYKLGNELMVAHCAEAIEALKGKQ